MSLIAYLFSSREWVPPNFRFLRELGFLFNQSFIHFSTTEFYFSVRSVMVRPAAPDVETRFHRIVGGILRGRPNLVSIPKNRNGLLKVGAALRPVSGPLSLVVWRRFLGFPPRHLSLPLF